MGKEIERKFLINLEKWNYEGKQTKISQGYLFNDNNGVVRIRLCETKHNKYALLTIKSSTENITRDEFEYEIPYSDGLELMEKCSHKIEKTRYFLKGWEIDIFEGDNKGLVIAEIELDSEDQDFIKPDWVLEEVSNDSKYYNSNLIIHPYNLWLTKQESKSEVMKNIAHELDLQYVDIRLSTETTKQEYEESKAKVKIYEDEQARLEKFRVDAFEIDLTEYFKTTYIKEFYIQKTFQYNRTHYYIESTNPIFDEDYDGEFDNDIEKLALKHNINAGISSSCYGK